MNTPLEARTMFADILANATPEQRLEFATIVRDIHVTKVLTEHRELDPNLLRLLDENIARMKREQH
jgi:hypothetical protein